MLADWNQKISLVSRSSFDRSFALHFADSLHVIDLSRSFVRQAVADIGTGAGFPGILFAIRYPDIPITLYEKMEKRRNYLKEVLAQMKLTQARLSGEMTRREGADLYFARAVLPPGDLLHWLSSILRPSDRVVLNLGSQKKEFSVPSLFKRNYSKDYVLPGNEGSRQIEIYEHVPRGT